MKNPFTPSFGSEPLVLAGRRDIIEGMRRGYENGTGDPRLNSIVVGARGTGKTALLNIIPGIAQERGWACVSVTALSGMLEDIYQRAVAQALDILDDGKGARLTGLTIGSAVGATWELPDEPEGNWRTRMYRVLDTLESQGTGLLITVDEVTSDLDEMIQFAAVYQHFVREGRSVALLMAGLPNNVSSLLSNKSASFLRRAKQYRLGRISDADMAFAIRQTVEGGGRSIEREALDLAVKASSGFPYMMQLVGFHTWESSEDGGAIDADAVARGIEVAGYDMRDGVYRSTLRDLSAKDIDFLQAMLEDEGESRMADVARRMGVSSSYASQYRLRLIDQGVIGERGRGRVWFDIPGFDSYLREEL